MKAFCDYHPTKPAKCYCPRCDATYCADCVTNRVVEQYGKKKNFHLCPQCNLEVDRLAMGGGITPFWTRLPKFFVYPFHLQPLGLMVVLSIATALFSKQTFFCAVMRAIIWGILLKYAFAALKAAANGNFKPPKVNAQTILADFSVVFKQIWIYIILIIALIFVARDAGVIVGVLFLCLAILSIPAMIIVLVCTQSLLSALNPMIFIRMAWRIGWGYLLMYFFLVLLGSAPAVLGQYVIKLLPANSHLFFLTMAESFYTIISYHLMGYVIFQYHEAIGYTMELDQEDEYYDDEVSEQDETNETLNRVDILIKEGNIDEAISVLRNDTEGIITHLNLAERYYNLLKIKQIVPEMLEHGKAYLDLLAKANQNDKICEVYSECVSKDARFTPNPSSLLKVGSCLNTAGNPKGAIQAYNRFIKANPKNTLIPKAYFLAANIINEQLNNPNKAVGILKGLIKTYPNHEITPYVQKYLGQIKAS